MNNSCVVNDNSLIPTQGDFIELRTILALLGGKVCTFLMLHSVCDLVIALRNIYH